jgi:rhodanese-related sulfurtransferase
LDVRYEEEYDEAYIPGSTLIPLPDLRRRYNELDPDTAYVAYCKGGKRSAVACLLLKQLNYEAVSLTGGITDWPHEVIRNY